MEIFKIKEVSTGFGRVLYHTKNPDNETIYYLIQGDRKHGMEVYRASLPPWYEPQTLAHPKDFSLFEIPKGETRIESDVRWFLESKLEEQKNER